MKLENKIACKIGCKRRNMLFTGKKPVFFFALYMSDVMMFMLSSLAASLFVYGTIMDSMALRLFTFTLLILLMNYSSFGLYNDKRALFSSNDFMNIIYSVVITYLIISVLMLTFALGDIVALFFLITIAGVLICFTTIISRFILYRMIYFFRRIGYDRKRVIFFGEGNEDMVNKIKEDKTLGYAIIGATDRLEDLRKYLAAADIVFLTKEEIGEDLMEIIIANDQINWKIIPSAFNLVIDPVAFDEFKDYPIINVKKSKTTPKTLIAKRFMDILFSGAALLALSPLFLAVVLLIRITMPGPVFFKQERLGKDLKPFILYKFRSMVIGADSKKNGLDNEVNGLFKIKHDPRVTLFGKFMRRSCIDELPQLLNIFKGDMSIVGPRPHLKQELCYFNGWRQARFSVKPGLTGMWQVNGRHELNFDKAILYDIYYIKNMSVILDLSIIFKTIPAVLVSRGKF